MGLIFNRGCSSHHYGDKKQQDIYKIKENYRTKPDELRYTPQFSTDARTIEIKRKTVQKCVHENCNAEKEGWKTISKCSGFEFNNLMRNIEDYSVGDVNSKTVSGFYKHEAENAAAKVVKSEYRHLEELIESNEVESLEEMKDYLTEQQTHEIKVNLKDFIELDDADVDSR